MSLEDNENDGTLGWFELDSTHHTLETLLVTPWVLDVLPGCSVSSCLPSLKHLAADVRVSLSEDLLRLSQLRTFMLKLHDDSDFHPQQIWLEIVVNDSSQLSKLFLCGPIEGGVSVQITKPGLELECNEIDVYNLYHVPSSLSHFTAPKSLCAWRWQLYMAPDT